MDRKLNILLVEDNADDVLLLRQAFKKAGETPALHRVSDGLEAKAYLNGEGDYGDRATHPIPDFVLLDLNMPRMNGFELLEWLRQDSPFKSMIVYVVTASARESDIKRAYELHANNYIVKPSRVDQLVDFVRAIYQWHRYTALPPIPTAPRRFVTM
jgi:CheY-like chemotaxis protein